MMNKRQIGEQAESIACRFLTLNEYKILDRNFYTRGGEIDIIARDGEYLVFVEVKYRKDASYGNPGYAVNQTKQRKIQQTAGVYIKKKGLSFDQPIRFDVVEIVGEKIRVIKNAF